MFKVTIKNKDYYPGAVEVHKSLKSLINQDPLAEFHAAKTYDGMCKVVLFSNKTPHVVDCWSKTAKKAGITL